jgi:hypothetical protein
MLNRTILTFFSQLKYSLQFKTEITFIENSYQLVLNFGGGFVKKFLGLSIPFPGSEPFLQQIFVKRIAKSPDRRVLLTPLSSLRVEIIRVKVFGSLRADDDFADFFHLLDVLGVAGDLGQVGELHMKGSEFGQNARTAAGPTEIFGGLKKKVK